MRALINLRPNGSRAAEADVPHESLPTTTTMETAAWQTARLAGDRDFAQRLGDLATQTSVCGKRLGRQKVHYTPAQSSLTVGDFSLPLPSSSSPNLLSSARVDRRAPQICAAKS